jgi:3-hydroxyacyl-[acyl-carrier-protein] dehydratase
MPTPPLMNVDEIDPNNLIVTRDQIYEKLPHRYEFMQLDGLVHLDEETGLAVGLRLVKEDEFWVRGHIPGRPLFPGVLMLETAAQMAAYLAQVVMPDQTKFLAFGGLENVKFRQSVSPPSTMLIVEKVVEARRRRFICDAQGWQDGAMVFEGRITGLPL